MANEDSLNYILQPLVALAPCLKIRCLQLNALFFPFPTQSCPHNIGGPTVCVSVIDEIRELIQLSKKQHQNKSFSSRLCVCVIFFFFFKAEEFLGTVHSARSCADSCVGTPAPMSDKHKDGTGRPQVNIITEGKRIANLCCS